MPWTEPPDVVAKLKRRWTSGELLRTFVDGGDFEPIGLAISGPRPGEIAGDLEAVRAWSQRWERACRSGRPIRLERREIGGRVVGRNELPSRAWIDSYDDAWAALGVGADVRDLQAMMGRTQDERLVRWVASHPLRALDARQYWQRLLDTVDWITAHQSDNVYLRQIDVPAVDTKFVETHRTILSALLDIVLGPERRRDDVPVSDFARRYRFASKPAYVRFRYLDPMPNHGPYTEMSVRTGELRHAPIGAERVFVVENEITYLAFPPTANAIVIFGAGYGLRRLRAVEWLADRELVYWGDIDTHGLAILNQLRATFGEVRSILMDRDTLLRYHPHWSHEPKQFRGDLTHLDEAESDLYAELLAGVHGPSVRLEQERIPLSDIETHLA